MPMIVPAPVRRLSPTIWIASARSPRSDWPGRASEPRQRTQIDVAGVVDAWPVSTSTSDASLWRTDEAGTTKAVQRQQQRRGRPAAHGGTGSRGARPSGSTGCSS